MSEEILLQNGYKYFPNEHHNHCDRYYQKKLYSDEDELVKFISVYYYDTFQFNGALDYKFEFELTEETEKFWKNTHIYAIDKEYTLEQIEKILLEKK